MKTDYFIYSNKVAREQGARTNLMKTRYISRMISQQWWLKQQIRKFLHTMPY